MPAFVVGDVHGHRDTLVRLLRDAGLLDRHERWSGAEARLWLVGDLVDRGPDGVGAIELVMRLEQESSGSVRCLVGNHEALILAVARFADRPIDDTGLTFRALWTINGGNLRDLDRLEPGHLAWIERMPAAALDGEWLIVHADTDAYLRLGATRDRVDAAAAAALRGEPDDLGRLLEVLSDRGAFSQPGRLERLLAALGGTRVVHGHTPIASVLDEPPSTITRPLVYAGGRAVDVDHCLFAGGPGFVVELDRGGTEAAPATVQRGRFGRRRRA